jgi:hypothetical protein
VSDECSDPEKRRAKGRAKRTELMKPDKQQRRKRRHSSLAKETTNKHEKMSVIFRFVLDP